MHRVHFRKEDVTIEVPDGTNLRQACLDSGIDPYPALGGLLSCRGKGFCGTCVVGVDDPEQLGAASRREARFLKKLSEQLRGTLRLSCQAEITGDLAVTTDPDKKESWKTHPFYSGRAVRSWEKP